MAHALLVDDDIPSSKALAMLLQEEGFTTSLAGSLEEARGELQSSFPDFAFVDLELPDGSGMELISELQGGPEIDIVVLTGHATIDSAIEALRLGVFDYLAKPVETARLQKILAALTRTLELRRQVVELRDQLRTLGRFGQMVGISPAIQGVFDLITKVAPTDSSVFVLGETGVGKDVVAQTIHRLSKRSARPYVPVNCGAIQPSLIESELFGHEAGSFTGASKRHQGVFERARGGTLFLDEIIEMPPNLQVKLLRVIETKTLTRVGGTKPVEVDFRLIAATNRDPHQAVEEDLLREDVLYRLMVFPIHVPPLRERREDVEILANYMLEAINEDSEGRKRFTPEAIARLESYSWPGNVRQLRNVVERASILGGDRIGPECIMLEGQAAPDAAAVSIRLGSSIADAERKLILSTLEFHAGDKKRAAKTLGISLKTLYARLSRYGDSRAASAN